MLKPAVDVFAAHIDLIEFGFSISGSILCIYIAQVILQERAPFVQLQRWAMGALAIAMFANGVSEYEPWNLLGNFYRPSGVIVYVVLFFNLLVMAFRGRIVTQTRDRGPRSQD